MAGVTVAVAFLPLRLAPRSGSVSRPVKEAEENRDMGALSVVGLGKLGACMAAVMAHRGFDVIGVDLNPAAVAAIDAGQAPVYEPGLAEMLEESSQRLRATSDYREAVLATDATFVIVPTPSEADGRFSLDYVKAVGEELGAALRVKDDYHLVVLTSTVLPGATEDGLLPVLERASGKRCGGGFGLCYSPEFIALGSVLHDFLNPDMILIGESDQRAGDTLAGIYEQVVGLDVPIQRMGTPNAELAKISLNTFVTTKITFANMLAEMCEQLPGGDIDAVTEALGLDTRIGGRYFSGGLGFGGPCFPRDNAALRVWSDDREVPGLLASSTDRLNSELGERTVAKVAELCLPDHTAVVLGLSYKPGSPVLDGSAALRLAEGLLERGVPVVAYDPLADLLDEDAIDQRIEAAGSLDDALDRAGVVVIANPEPAFAELRETDFPPRRVIVYDCWRLLRRALSSSALVDYRAVGLAPSLDSLRIDRDAAPPVAQPD